MLDLRLQPAQTRAYLSTATEILYGGAAGGGKSHLMRVCAILWALMIPGLQIALFRRLYPDLQRNHMEGPNSFPVLLAALVKSGHCRIVKDEITFYNGSRISLNHCQHEKDKYKYQGAEFHVLLMDELTHFTESQYRYLRGRVRMTGLNLPDHLKKLFPRIVCGANPGGVGHVWVKNTFVINGAQRIVQTGKSEGGMLRQYLPAKLSDNAALLRDDPHYADKLEGLGDPILVRAMLDGDWSVAAGAMFGDTWRDPVHICDPFAIPIDWKIWRGGDDGFSSAAAVAWMTQDPVLKTVYVLAEIYRTKMMPKEYAERTARVDKAIRRWVPGQNQVIGNAAKCPGYLDSSAFRQDGTSDIVRGTQINAELSRLGAARFIQVPKWNGSRVHGIQNFHRILARNPNDPAGGPGIRFFRTCRRLIETIPALMRDDKDPEDIADNQDDHGFDAVRYGLQYKIGSFRHIKMGS